MYVAIVAPCRHIIMMFTNTYTCAQAYQRGFKYPKYLFLTYGSHEMYWWATNDNRIKCAPKEMAEALQYSLAALHFPSLPDEMESPNVKAIAKNRDEANLE